MTFRKKQETADIILTMPLIKKDGAQAVGLTLATLSTKIIKPDGTALTGYTEAVFTEPNGDGVYACKFPSNAATKAFTLEDQPNPYTVTLDSSTADVEPTTIEVWIVSRLQSELAREATLFSNIATGTLQSNIATTGSELRIKRGDKKKLTLSLTTDWTLTGGKKVYLCVKADPAANNSTAKINRAATVLTATTAEITLTSAETETIGKYSAEWEVRESDDSAPQTAQQFILIIEQDVRQ